MASAIVGPSRPTSERALSADINTIERAGKQPAIAKKYGIDVKDPEAIKAKVKEMKAQRAAWDNWASDPKLVDQIRREISGEPVAEAVPPEAKPEAAPIKIVKVEPSKWAGTGFGTKGASYGVEGDPNIMIRRESHGWTAFDKTTNDSRFGETKAELEKEEQQKQAAKKYTIWQALKDPKVLRLALIYFLWVIGFWGSIAFVLYGIKKQNQSTLFVGAGMISMYVPYLLLSITGRVMFPYYFIYTIPFVSLGIVLLIDVIKQKKLRIFSNLILLGIVVWWFVLHYPLQILTL